MKVSVLQAIGSWRRAGARRSGKAAAVVLLLSSITLQAQQTRPGRQSNEPLQQPSLMPANLSPLGLDNLGRVAASATQIVEVLRKEPGLLVELKRLVAKDATDHGQIVDDSDLADQGIFDRLEWDSPFRAAATRLLQRYGYLMPKLNPDSEAAREEDLLFQERRYKLRRALADLDRPQETRPEALTAGQSRAASEKDVPSETAESTFGDLPLPLLTPRPNLEELERSIPQHLRAGAESPSATAERSAELLASVALAAPLNEDRSMLDRQLRERNRISAAPAEAGPSLTTRPTRDAGHKESLQEIIAQTDRAANEAASFDRAAITHSAKPFANIPSLYDIYLHASQRTPVSREFGLDLFRGAGNPPNALPMDLPVGPDYVVGPGDGLEIDLWGSVAQRLYRIVDREGRLALPEVGPVLVSGRTMGEVQQAVQRVLRTQFRDVSADVSLARLRTIRVYVVGDVERPGAYDVSSLSTPLNALFAAAGPTPRGSLRNVKHYRGDRLIQVVDLYDLLLRGVHSDLKRLETGDSLMVSPIGPQVTVEGMVRRPAIYELHGEKTLADVLDLAGGILPTATLRHIEVQRLEAHQKRTMLSLDIPEGSDGEATSKQLVSFAIQNGDSIHVFPIALHNQDAIYLEGHVLRPGRYSFHPGMKLTDLLSSYKDLLPEPAERYAEIVRLNGPDFRPSVESFDVAAALANPESAPKLQPLDTVRIFSRYDFEDAPTVTVSGEVRRPGTHRTSGQVHVRDAIQLSGGLKPDARTEVAQVFSRLPDSRTRVTSVNLTEALAGNPLENILLQPRDHILVHRNLARVDPPSISIRGEIAKPGRYPLTINMRVADLISIAGGLKRSADTEAADLTEYLVENPKHQRGENHEIKIAKALSGDPDANLLLRDGDTLTIRQLPGWNDIGAYVVVRGEVQHPGTYGIRPGERLSSVLARAGGFLPTAYPQGAVFERQDVRRFQEKSKQELIQRIEQEASSFKASLQQSAQDQVSLQQAAFQQRQRAIEALQKSPVTGRLVIRLRSNSAAFESSADNIELRSGDALYVPKRPNFVLVTGQVYNSNASTLVPRRNAGWYLKQAGGSTGLADKKAIFIVRADGSVVSGKGEGWWTGGVLSTPIEPGDMIVVPEKAVGGSTTWKNLLGLAQIAQSAAVAALVVTR